MQNAANAITHIPIWVWGILAYLIYVGIKALKPRVVTLPYLIILPLVLISLKYRIFTLPDAWVYFAGILIGLVAGFLKVRNKEIKIFKKTQTIEIPGSSSLIVILLSFFAMKYYFGYLQATDPVAYARQIYWDLGLSGVLSGYFSGQRANFLYRYFNEKT